jgi:uncharacterized damage-inducible protein DinB
MLSLTPDQTALLLKVSVFSLENEHGITKKILEAVPADQAGYRPDPNARTALDLAWHIAAVENMFMDAVATGEFNFAIIKQPEAIRTPGDVVRWYAENFSANIDRLHGLSPEQLAKTIDFRGIFQFPAVLFLEVGLKHTIHHRGQLSVYLRPLGSKVPSIYGESYDDRQTRLAAQASS